ncbi:lytic murein transglycosylase B [Lentisalinibacter sediminis]|uniref:lytic murein transglycosylase B n=1 Tax=Lentisalinibacter sediminis TaxID=2992237 RepID=UPI00386776E6
MRPVIRSLCLLSALAALAGLTASPARALDTSRADVAMFIDEVAERHGFDRAEVERTLGAAETQQPILDAISRPAEKVKPWHEYRAIFLTPERIEAGAAFWREHAEEIARVGRETGVDPEIIVAIIGVETYFGRITGRYRVLDALATLAFDYPPRSPFFRRELEQFLLLAREERVDVDTALGSYAGAMGAPQFMPSSYRAYAVDASADGLRDLWTDWSDVFGSVANYLKAHGWRAGEPVFVRATTGSAWSGEPAGDKGLDTDTTVARLSAGGIVFSTALPGEAAARLLRMEGEDAEQLWVGFHNFHVITRYNRSAMYALAVWQLGREIALAVADGAGDAQT